MPSSTLRCSVLPEGSELPSSSVMVASLPYWPFSILVFTSWSVNESRRANSSLPVLPMVSSASSVFVRPGICTRIWSVPCTCTTASEAPSAFTRLSMMARLFSMSSVDTAWPFSPFAVSTTDRPPWMSRPWLIFSCGGANMKIEPTTSKVVAMRSQTLRRSTERPGFFFDFWAVAMESSPSLILSIQRRAERLRHVNCPIVPQIDRREHSPAVKLCLSGNIRRFPKKSSSRALPSSPSPPGSPSTPRRTPRRHRPTPPRGRGA